jgi:hypothetical protein
VAYLIWLVVIGSSIWVAADASSIGARKGLVPGFFNMGVAGWFFACLLLWIVAFPGYLATRNKIKAAAQWGPGAGGYQAYGAPQWQAQWQPQWRSPEPPRPALSTVGWTIPGGVPTPTSHPPTPSAGWYLDPQDHTLLRWWDGVQRTDHRTPTAPS